MTTMRWGRLWPLAGVLWAGATAVRADDGPAVKTRPDGWKMSLTLRDQTLAQGIPVSALDTADWFRHVNPNAAVLRATVHQEVLAEATHASGWRLGAIARGHADVTVSADAARLARVLDSEGFPAQDTNYQLQAQGEGWRGRGVKLGSPWWTVANTSWQWRADVVGLELTDWRQASLTGEAQGLSGAQSVDFNVQGTRAGRGVRGPFLGHGDKVGYAWSLSLDARAQLAPDWHLQLRASELVSRLHWKRSPAESLAINTAVEQLRPDGAIDYAPAVQGRQFLTNRSGRMHARWQGVLTWQATSKYAASMAWQRMAGMSQTWLGVSRGAADSSEISWTLAADLQRRGVKGRLEWGPAFLEVATDTRGAQAELRQLHLGVAYVR